MEIYLVRHTRPLIGEGICYGQTDVDVDMESYEQTAIQILNILPEKAAVIYSSPLIRCSKLAQYMQKKKYPAVNIVYSHLLKEMDFGDWENKKWDDIHRQDLHKWMNDFVDTQVPGGESFIELHARTQVFLQEITHLNFPFLIIVTHAGVIRSILSHTRSTSLKDAFTIDCTYGSVIKTLI